jgi:hypothetical protein
LTVGASVTGAFGTIFGVTLVVTLGAVEWVRSGDGVELGDGAKIDVEANGLDSGDDATAEPDSSGLWAALLATVEADLLGVTGAAVGVAARSVLVEAQAASRPAAAAAEMARTKACRNRVIGPSPFSRGCHRTSSRAVCVTRA